MLLAAVLTGLPLGVCNTAHGIGKDIGKGGEAIQRAEKQ
jgi:predicted small secreted protein